VHVDIVGLGAALLLAGLVARAGQRYGLPTVPCYMLVGIALGPSTPGPVVVEHPEELALVATLGLVLLLFHLGVEFPLEQVTASGRRLLIAGAAFIGVNVLAGMAFGLALGWGASEALVIAGIMGVSSSAIVTKSLIELRRLTNAETPVILGIIVLEDLFLAVYLAMLSPIVSDADSTAELVGDVAISFGFLVALFLLARFGAKPIGALIGARQDELLIVVTVGLAVLVAGWAAEAGVSDAIGALLIGLVVSRTLVSERVERLILPLRDVFAAAFFVVFGLMIDVGDLGAVVGPTLVAVVVTLVATVAVGIFVARLFELNQRAAANLGLTMAGRGEFSLILATVALAAGLDERLGPFAALYVLVLAFLGPLLASQSKYLARVIPARPLRGSWQYVQQETITTACTHLDQIQVTETDIGVCPTCVELGDDWVELRLCMSCGHVGCCDDSPNTHAHLHADEAHHPIVQTLQPGETWRWCYVDEVLVREPAGGSR
jgi:CPA2 family monovalent cation:H+ antiporter-2